MHEDATCNNLQEIITQAINEIKQEQGEKFNLAKINLTELERRTGQKAAATVLTGYSGIIDGLLRKGVNNSSVCFERLQEAGYTGGLTSVKTYIADHRELVPPKRQLATPTGKQRAQIPNSPWGILSDGLEICTSRYECRYSL